MGAILQWIAKVRNLVSIHLPQTTSSTKPVMAIPVVDGRGNAALRRQRLTNLKVNEKINKTDLETI